ncbi:unnamed protein product [Urochloa humidicola]
MPRPSAKFGVATRGSVVPPLAATPDPVSLHYLLCRRHQRQRQICTQVLPHGEVRDGWQAPSRRRRSTAVSRSRAVVFPREVDMVAALVASPS